MYANICIEIHVGGRREGSGCRHGKDCADKRNEEDISDDVHSENVIPIVRE